MDYKTRAMTVTLSLLLLGCAGAQLTRGSLPGDTDQGLAVYYADSLHGKQTASGEPYDKAAFTAAHPALPFGAVVRVTNLANRRTVEVRINDRGPFGDRRRVIDVSRAAAERLDLIGKGVAEVKVEVVSMP